MKAIVLDSYGGPEVLGLRDIPDPEPGPEEVVVDVVATACNRADLLQRRGLYPGPPMTHEVPGLEVAGRVHSVGDRARQWEPGDEVMGIVAGGAYAERIAVHERQLMTVPGSVGMPDAGAVPEAFLTAWDALVGQGGLTAGRVALIHAGASGVGTAAIQIAKAMGATVVTTASTAKLEACRGLGADVAVDRHDEDFVALTREASPVGGADVVLDVVGGDYVDRNIDALAVGGRIVQVGVMGGGSAQVSIGKLLPKRATIVGTVLRSRPIEEKLALTQRFVREVLPLFATADLSPVIDERYRLADVAAAHEAMESNRNVGKILLEVGRP